jgi:hypothetical protein
MVAATIFTVGVWLYAIIGQAQIKPGESARCSLKTSACQQESVEFTPVCLHVQWETGECFGWAGRSHFG